MNERDLLDRTRQFALRVMRLAAAMPGGRVSAVIQDQLVRSGTSVGANYRTACRGRSPAEFISKLGIVEEEADESAFWLDLIIEGGLMKAGRVAPLREEAVELTRIMARSRLTASGRLRNRKSQIANRKSANTGAVQ